MQLLDIHSHILPAVDDGAKDIESSIELLKCMREQGITSVIATPHFYAMYHDIEEFKSIVKDAYDKLVAASKSQQLPEVGIGCEVFYFPGIGKSRGVRELTLCGSDYLLLELPSCSIDDAIIKDIADLRERLEIIPIIAHIERYSSERGFKKLLELVDNGTVYAQVNAGSFAKTSSYRRTVIKLIKKGYISFIATDTHSLEARPPMLDLAFAEIENQFSESRKKAFIENSDRLYDEIFITAEDYSVK